MPTLFENIKENYATITEEEKAKLTGDIVKFLKKAISLGEVELKIVSGEPIYIEKEGKLVHLGDIPIWTHDTFNFFLEHIVYIKLDDLPRKGEYEIHTSFFEKMLDSQEYPYALSIGAKGYILFFYAEDLEGTPEEPKYIFEVSLEKETK